MEYNSGRNKLIISEYGRNIQKMIEHAITIKDDGERNQAAKAIVAVMGYLNPHLRDIADFKHKLWDHLFIMSDFKLEVESPYPIPSKDTMVVKPKHLSYPSNKIRYKFYGKNMEMMIGRVAETEVTPAKEQITRNLANFMKMSYLAWNKDNVDDSTILDHLNQLSGERLKLNENDKLNQTQDLLAMSVQHLRKNVNIKNSNKKQMRNKKRR